MQVPSGSRKTGPAPHSAPGARGSVGVRPTSPHVLCGLIFFFLFFFFCQFTVEPASRNQRVVGGKGMKRKRSKKEVVKAPRKKRKGMHKSSAHRKKKAWCVFSFPLFHFEFVLWPKK